MECHKTGVKLVIIKGKTWSRGTNTRLPFGVIIKVNLNIYYIWQQVNILAIYVIGGVSVWFFKPFVMHPLRSKELGRNNTASFWNLVTLNLLWSIIINKEVKNCRNYNASGTFTYHFTSLREKNFFSIVPRTLKRTLATDYGH